VFDSTRLPTHYVARRHVLFGVPAVMIFPFSTRSSRRALRLNRRASRLRSAACQRSNSRRRCSLLDISLMLLGPAPGDRSHPLPIAPAFSAKLGEIGKRLAVIHKAACLAAPGIHQPETLLIDLVEAHTTVSGEALKKLHTGAAKCANICQPDWIFHSRGGCFIEAVSLGEMELRP
jgi:hypothetical protein